MLLSCSFPLKLLLNEQKVGMVGRDKGKYYWEWANMVLQSSIIQATVRLILSIGNVLRIKYLDEKDEFPGNNES